MNRRQLLATTGAVASLALCAGIVAGAPGCTPAPAAEPDALLDLVNEYREGLAAFNASGDLSPQEDRALQAATWGAPYDRLCTAPPVATTLAGALAGIRLVADEEENCGQQPDLTINVLRAALAYFDGRA
ncbi:hypothetical protein ACP4J4_20370 (plasmid) [Aureimonas ureilytica]|uniref:hypothetical protein n=1 Tax=Aureimonas ureilytica TaxID=401562 RepID=UPI003CEEC442